MLRRALVAMAFTAAFIGINSSAAQAIPPGPTLFVTAYYADSAKTVLIGQKWSGCNQPSGSWGTTSNIINYYFTPC